MPIRLHAVLRKVEQMSNKVNSDLLNDFISQDNYDIKLTSLSVVVVVMMIVAAARAHIDQLGRQLGG